MVSNVKVGVVTVTYNSSDVIDEFMDSMLKQTHKDYILYIIDNASADATLSKLSHYDDSRIVVVPNRENLGVAEGNNQGIKASLKHSCEHVLLINNDTVFEPELIEKLIAGLTEYDCQMVVPKMMYHEAPQLIWCAGGYFIPYKAYAGDHYGINQRDLGQYNQAKQITYSPTCCILINKQVFNLIGYMDEKYFVYYDDTDFCLRAMKAGLKLFYLPCAVLFHKVSSLTGGVESPFTIRYMHRNRVYYIRKHINWLIQPFWLILLQLWFLLQLIIKKDNFKTFQLKQKAFYEGLSLSLQ
ncbi:glycosyltransferase family 2 protein [Calothrix sp. FACHB-1219]|uniref:glycosyltransferase family 2 protein n=1 Tax=unclassified Calothrix TaxID=2619626 RepID=UPI001682C8CC|nr:MULTISPECIES: glycosyltransferase family 2 protein [unclassified Calothrix]MBD2201303.1 glycosyltransferase family 2 protein [Calothrix sp. FACHB-168]MBD2215737.1 glycosyltransferase family 2 protein [Calothrix sp. FACHB-1219]